MYLHHQDHLHASLLILTLRAVYPCVAFIADAAARHTLTLVAAVIGTGALPTIQAGEALMADTLAVLTAALAMAVTGAPLLFAVLAGEALMADALAIHTAALAVTVIGAGELRTGTYRSSGLQSFHLTISAAKEEMLAV